MQKMNVCSRSEMITCWNQSITGTEIDLSPLIASHHLGLPSSCTIQFRIITAISFPSGDSGWETIIVEPASIYRKGCSAAGADAGTSTHGGLYGDRANAHAFCQALGFFRYIDNRRDTVL